MLMYFLSHLRMSIFHWGRRPKILGRVWRRGMGKLAFGANVVLDGRALPIELYVKAGGRLDIADDVSIAAGASIEATAAVALGRGCRVGALCKIMDTNWHSLRRREKIPSPVPIEIGDNVVLEDNVILLPGARIGDNVTIRARSVVSRAIPANVEVAGYPARIVGRKS